MRMGGDWALRVLISLVVITVLVSVITESSENPGTLIDRVDLVVCRSLACLRLLHRGTNYIAGWCGRACFYGLRASEAL